MKGHWPWSRSRSRSPFGRRPAAECPCAASAEPISTWLRGDLARKRSGVTPGHEIVGRVDALGDGSTGSRPATGSACRGCGRWSGRRCPRGAAPDLRVRGVGPSGRPGRSPSGLGGARAHPLGRGTTWRPASGRRRSAARTTSRRSHSTPPSSSPPWGARPGRPCRARLGRHPGNRRNPSEQRPASGLRRPPFPGAKCDPLERADDALADLAHDRVTGAAVLTTASPGTRPPILRS